MTRSLLHGRRVAITGGTSGLGLALVRELHRRGAAVAFVARTADRVHAVAAEVGGTCGIVGDVSRKEDIYPIAMQITAALAGSTSSSTTPRRWAPFRWCRSRTPTARTSRRRWPQRRRAVPADEGAARRAGRVRARGAGAADRQHLERCRREPYPNWGAYARAGGARPHAHLREELVGLGIDAVAVDPGDMDTPMHALAVPDANRGALKRPADAAVEIAELIEARVRATAGARERLHPAVAP